MFGNSHRSLLSLMLLKPVNQTSMLVRKLEDLKVLKYAVNGNDTKKNSNIKYSRS